MRIVTMATQFSGLPARFFFFPEVIRILNGSHLKCAVLQQLVYTDRKDCCSLITAVILIEAVAG